MEEVEEQEEVEEVEDQEEAEDMDSFRLKLTWPCWRLGD